MSRCKALHGYSRLVALIREREKKGPLQQEDISHILRQCQEKGVLMKFLEKHGREAVNALFYEMTDEEILELEREDGYLMGHEAGVEEGREEGINALSSAGLEDGLSEEEILQRLQKYFGLDLTQAEKQFQKWSASI